MFRDRAEAVCSPIAEKYREKIREDSRRVKSANVAKLLKEIDKDLLHPDIRVEELRLRCGIRDKNVSTVFKRELGLAPKEYSIDKRMRVAAEALATSDVEVWRIGVKVGYLTPANFGRAFKTWSKQTPEEFRENARAGRPPAPAVSVEEIQQALAGDLEEAEAAALIGQLGDLQDRIREGYQALRPGPYDRYLSERMAAAYLWRCIEHQPHEIQQAAVESQSAGFQTPAFFLVLSTASVEAADHDAERATRLAELALASLQAIEERLGDAAPPYQVRAHAVAGHALTCAGRLDDARRAFVEALEPYETMNDAPNRVVLAELTLYLGLFQAMTGELEKADRNLQAHSLLMRELVDRVKELEEEGGEG